MNEANSDRLKLKHGMNNVYTNNALAEIRHKLRDDIHIGVGHLPYYYHDNALLRDEKYVFIDDVEVFVALFGIQSLTTIIEGANKLFMTSGIVDFLECLNRENHSHLTDIEISTIKYIESIPGCKKVHTKLSDNKHLPDGYIDGLSSQYDYNFYEN